jgi:polysaccharide deacetylase family protein (PEP-CTERM system associated)
MLRCRRPATRSRPEVRIAVIHAFTVDVEDWYHGIPVTPAVKSAAERRLERGLLPLLDLMDRHGAKGTFYLLGPVAKEHADLCREIARRGHELGCHGWSHDLLYTMTPERFRDETRRAVDAIGEATGTRVRTYRAAYFSVTRASWWALEELAALGFDTDSSIFPVRNWRYGIPDFPDRPTTIETRAGRMLELPLNVRRLAGRTIPVTGGAYLRIYPYALTRANLRALEAAGRAHVFYIHPWELDPDHPRVPFHWKARLTHYHNLGSTAPKLERLLTDFRFEPVGKVFAHELAHAGPAPLR